MATYNFGICEDANEIVLWMQTPRGPKPILGWQKLDPVRGFAEMLLDWYCEKKMQQIEIMETADDIICRVFDESGLSFVGLCSKLLACWASRQALDPSETPKTNDYEVAL